MTRVYAQVLTGARNLRELLLDGSELGVEGGLELARIVRECPLLEVLSVATCALKRLSPRQSLPVMTS